MLILEAIIIDNHQVSIDNLNMTGDLAFLVIFLGKRFSSPKWCFKCKLHQKIWIEHEHIIGEGWTIKSLILFSGSNSTGSARIDVKETPIWDFIEVDKYICPVLHNQINLGNNVLYNLCDYGNVFIEKLTINEQVACNSLSLINGSINKRSC